MARKGGGFSLQDLRSKPVAICAVFAVAWYLRQLRKDPASPDAAEKQANGCPAGTSVATELPDGSVELSVPYKDGWRVQRVQPTSNERFDRDYPLFARSRRSFGKETSALLKILVPSYKAKVLRYLVLHIALLMFRTYMSLLVADLDGRIVRHLIGANGPAFAAGLVEWLALAVPASYTNAMIRYLEGKIGLEFRGSMVRYIHDLYVGAHAEYYKLSSTDGQLEGIDHYITADVTKFCTAAAKLYSNLGKPTLDLFIFAAQLSRNLGGRTMCLIAANYLVTAGILRAVAPAFGKLAAREAQLEGDYRSAHARVITNAEEIAFYDGAEIEKRSLGSAYRTLCRHIAKQMSVKAAYAVIESYVLKYSWSASGYVFAAVPVFFPNQVKGASAASTRPATKLAGAQPTAPQFAGSRIGASERENMGKFVTNKRIMLSISDAGGRIMYSIKDMAELAGHTRRVYQLIAALHRVRKQAYHRRSSADQQLDVHGDQFTLADVRGKLEIAGDDVEFSNVPVVVPGSGADLSNGEQLLDPLQFGVKRGQHLLIVGSNGTGKSSIARLVAGLWPVYRGVLRRARSICFLPQRPYFSTATLRDQIIYPSTVADMQRRNVSDADLHAILKRVNLAYLPDREGGLDVVKEWKDVFSGGEKQRMLFARILYASPKYAIIDEGTSAVSADMEGQLYEACVAQGITLITISHRLSLLQYHEMKLEVGLGDDGTGWSFENTAQETGWRSMEKEIEDIKTFLATVPDLQRRREEVVELLKR